MGASRRASPTIYRLTVEGRSVSFRRGERVRIGRDPDNELVLEDTSVSRFHARVDWGRRVGLPFVTDLGSSNGTYVDGVRRLRASLTELSRLVLGDVRVSLLLVETAQAAAGGMLHVRLPDECWADSSGYLRAAEGVHALLLELERSRRTASFRLTDAGGFEARVTFVRGRIVHAAACAARGLDALHLLLSRPTGGSYAVSAGDEAQDGGGSGAALPPLYEVLARRTSLAS